jgi:RNA 2',3'-cyclic 3'-phosphodiesterase
LRTFIAVPLPAQCTRTLAEMQGALRRFGADVRWTAVPSIHLTLKFLGEIDPAVLPGLSGALRALPVPEPFTLRLEGMGAFPNLQRPRVIWCGIEGDRQALSLLQQGVEKACIQAGFEREGRPFQPHLTLGRVQGRRNLQALLDYIRIGPSPGCDFVVDHYRIYRSTLTPQGAIYDVLESIQLRS